MIDNNGKIAVLAEFWKQYRHEPLYADYFYTYYDACHTAYLIDHKIVEPISDIIISLSIEEAFSEFLNGFNIDNTDGLKTLDDFLAASPNQEVEV